MARGPLKALRYGTEGVRDKSGIVVQYEVGVAELLGQASGFSPSSVRNSFEGKSAVVQHDRALQARRSALSFHSYGSSQPCSGCSSRPSSGWTTRETLMFGRMPTARPARR